MFLFVISQTINDVANWIHLRTSPNFKIMCTSSKKHNVAYILGKTLCNFHLNS